MSILIDNFGAEINNNKLINTIIMKTINEIKNLIEQEVCEGVTIYSSFEYKQTTFVSFTTESMKQGKAKYGKNGLKVEIN